jgi:LysR family transcriptional regulator, glycine cleavage system transcriptional activator
MRKLPPLGMLRAFEAAARHLSFKAAADELGVTPTAISHQIRQLEQLSGQALFRRSPRPLALTACGARLFPVLKEGLDSFAAAMAGISDETEQPLPLRLTTTNAFAHRWLVPRLPLWQQAHPRIALDVNGTDALIDLRAGEADVAIRYQRHPPSALASHELFRDTFWPVCSPALLAAMPVHRASDLEQHTLIHMYWQPWEPSPPTWPFWLQAARALDPETPTTTGRGSLNFREELHAIEAVIAGQGVGLLSDLLVGPELESGALVKVLDPPLPGFGFYFTHVPDHPRKVVIESFRAWISSIA